MALIANFVKEEKPKAKVHDAIDAHIYVFDSDRGKIVQIDTYGRGSREIPGKLSQTIQLDRQSAEVLFATLREEFNFS